MGKGSKETSTTTISPELRGPATDIMKALMMAGSTNPWDLEYSGPRMAAVNEQQKQAMDAVAQRGQSMGLNFTSARNSLPESVMMDGFEVYDTLGLARQGITPEMQAIYDGIYGPGGLLSKYGPNPQDPTSGAGGVGSGWQTGLQELGELDHYRSRQGRTYADNPYTPPEYLR